MQLALYFECDDIKPEQLCTILRELAHGAYETVEAHGIPRVDHEHGINVTEMPLVWGAQLCRHA